MRFPTKAKAPPSFAYTAKEGRGTRRLFSLIYFPLPVSDTCWDPFQTLSRTVKVALRLPVLPGTKLTVMVQLVLAARDAGQPVVLAVKSEAFAPPIPKLVMVSSVFPELVRVRDN